MLKEVKIPEVGESITEGTLTEWFAEDGGVVKMDDALFELETDKVTMEVVAEYSGRLSKKVEAGTLVEVGRVVATIDTDAAAGETKAPLAPSEKSVAGIDAAAALAPTEPAIKGGEAPKAAVLGNLSPAVRRLVAEHGLDPSDINGTGKDGQILKADVLAFLEAPKPAKAAKPDPATDTKPEAIEQPAAKAAAKSPVHPPAAARAPGERQTRRTMTNLRKRIAERLVEAQHNAAMLTTFNEVDMSGVMAMRKKHQDAFVKKNGIKLGMMSFFVKAAVDALVAFPQLNAMIDGDEIVENHYYDIGIAVGSDRGLLVPVLRDCEARNFAEIELAIGDLAGRVRNKTIKLDELTGGVFTITNGGVYGSLMSTPILNPPQSGILGMHAIKKRPVAVGDEIVIRPMMYLALSYDHRLVDGKDAVSFLKRIVDCVENPERMMLEV